MERNTYPAPLEAIVVRLLAIQLAHERAIARLEDAGIELPEDIRVDLIDLIADWYGIPEDNTVETDACSRANTTGTWPDDAYCRDWLMHEWDMAIDNSAPFGDFIKTLRAEAARCNSQPLM